MKDVRMTTRWFTGLVALSCSLSGQAPDTIVHNYGADSLRLYEMFMGPLEQVKPWSTAGVVGVRGFLDRAWRLIVDAIAQASA